MDLDLFLKCNKIKDMKITVADMVEALAGSAEVELSANKKQVRRIGNKALPEKTAKEGKAAN